MAVYIAEIRRVAPLSRAEEVRCIQQVCAGGAQAGAAAKRLLEAHLGLVVSIAEGYAGGGISLLELVQSGNRGLMEAIEVLRDTEAGSFEANATAYIHRAIAALLDDLGAI
jgi:DNA-directed RNA polymerase sigma subunit (sigma70/sigma32)